MSPRSAPGPAREAPLAPRRRAHRLFAGLVVAGLAATAPACLRVDAGATDCHAASDCGPGEACDPTGRCAPAATPDAGPTDDAAPADGGAAAQASSFFIAPGGTASDGETLLTVAVGGGALGTFQASSSGETVSFGPLCGETP